MPSLPTFFGQVFSDIFWKYESASFGDACEMCFVLIILAHYAPQDFLFNRRPPSTINTAVCAAESCFNNVLEDIVGVQEHPPFELFCAYHLLRRSFPNPFFYNTWIFISHLSGDSNQGFKNLFTPLLLYITLFSRSLEAFSEPVAMRLVHFRPTGSATPASPLVLLCSPILLVLRMKSTVMIKHVVSASECVEESLKPYLEFLVLLFWCLG